MKIRLNIKRTITLSLLGLLVIIVSATLILREHYVVPILMYHSISEDSPDKDNLLAISADTFNRQMEFLQTRKYNVISLKELARLMREDAPLPHNTVVITFDDGYQDNFTVVFPIIKKYDIPITIFICPMLISEEEQYLTWPQVKKLSDSSLVDIGSHTLNHTFLPDLKGREESLIMQISGSKEILEDILKVPIDSFSYPAGGFNKNIRRIVEESGYRVAVATKPGLDYPDDDIFALKRLRISEHNKNMFIFWVKLTGLYTKVREWQRKDKDKDLKINYE
ncbi:MAG: polysaccharide deacetylase family protein [Candidatus Omnitrophica bacterium]|nr:polysaccharide deacetylase family protein [Candidatus Omnitrophota bacterium]